jgi:hypothetical protein
LKPEDLKSAPKSFNRLDREDLDRSKPEDLKIAPKSFNRLKPEVERQRATQTRI